MNHKKKSATKASGFKSAFIVGDKVVTTSFGKGNTAILEKEVTDDVVRELNTKDSNYDLDIITEKGKKRYKIKGKWINKLNEDNTDSDSDEKKIVTGDDPREYSIMRDNDVERIGMDAIRIKDKVEEEIFGKAFPEDNIHIQLAYNILDIKKLLAVHVNNIIYSLNNLAHKNGASDFIGTFPSKLTLSGLNNDNKLCDQFNNFINAILPYMPYHPSIFYEKIEIKKIKNKHKTICLCFTKDYFFSLFRILSDVRQSCVHGANSIYTFDMLDKTDTHIKEKREYLDKMYNKKIYQVNNDFVNNNKTNLHILYKLYNAESAEQKSEIVNSYYKFIVVQESKNLGFSIREIRELMLEIHLGKLKEKGYDSIRGKVYTLIDYILYRYYTDIDNVTKAEYFVNSLRSSLSDEERSRIYTEQCNVAFNFLKSKLTKLMADVNAGSIKNLVKDAKKDHIDISRVKLQSKATYFVKTLYVLTLFLDGKEINELISSLINKFDNIASFISVMKECGIPCNFENDYKLFAESEKISRELRTLKSFARMKLEIPKATNEMFNDAVCILGLIDKNGKLILEYNDEQNKYLEHYVDNKIFDDTKPENERDKTLKNFLINNVIKSRRFWYVIRYINPKSARRLMSNKEIIDFVLKRLPDAQINRYYTSVTDKPIDGITVAEQKKYLCEELLKMNINRFEKVPKFAKDGAKKIQKERYKAIIGLYLTVLYLLTKNLVNVNSRYTIACCCLERDSKLHGLIEENEYKENGEPDYKKICDRLVDKAINEKWINKRYRGYFKVAEKNKDAGSDRKHYHKQLHIIFRNAIVHLNAVMDADKYIEGIKNIDSYFMIYHYIVQRYIVKNAKLAWINQTPAFKNQFESAVEHNTYSKNIVKGLCLPFGYNLSRFKNLTVMEVFNRKEILEERKKAAENKD